MVSMQMSAQTMKDIIKTMPDSITPLLTKNARLDFIDYLEANQKAVEKNKLGGESEMTKLTETRSVIQLSKSSKLDFKLLKGGDEPTIGIISTMTVDEKTSVSMIRYYSLDWTLKKVNIPSDFKYYEWNDDNEELTSKVFNPFNLEIKEIK